MRRVRLTVVFVLCASLLVPAALQRGAAAYEFEVEARTIGQGYQLTSFRRLGPNLLLRRARFTQTLSLSLWDLSNRLRARKLHDSSIVKGPRFYFTSYMRIDHDFGAWNTGQLTLNNTVFDAVDLIPELETNSLALDVLYGYVAAEGLWGGRLDLYLGRQLDVDTLDWWSMDGLTARVKTPLRLAVEGFGGLRVRDTSPVASGVQEPDGTAGGECAEYVEGETPGSGGWRPIDREITGEGNPFSNDFDFCPQRDKLMPTWGGAIETDGLDPIWARVSYRRSQSKTVGLIGDVGRFEYDDTGLYPNELGQAPGWGVNEERVAATVRANVSLLGGKLRVVPYLAARYSILHGLFDEGHAGARVRYGAHSLESELYYQYPTFDGDSIFNVFSVQPYTDVRLTYELHPRGAKWRAYMRGWYRQFFIEGADASELASNARVSDEQAAGAQVGGRYIVGRDKLVRLDLFHEDGYGGRRTGAYTSSRWRLRQDLAVSGRLSLVSFDEDVLSDLHATSFGVQAGASYIINPEFVAVHLLIEENNNRFNDSQVRILGVLDLAFKPET